MYKGFTKMVISELLTKNINVNGTIGPTRGHKLKLQKPGCIRQYEVLLTQGDRTLE